MTSNEKKILIVDDEPNIRQSFLDFFEDRDWQVFSTDSGEAALEVLETQPCNAAVVDIRMGGMDGETFIRKAYEKCPEMFFVMCTGSPEYKAPEDLKKSPCVCDQIFGKPVINMGELEQKILNFHQFKK